MQLISMAERHLLPDTLVRYGIRYLIKQRLQSEHAGNTEQQNRRYRQLLQEMRQAPIAIETRAANQQHYELPADFFHFVLGKRLKYSACLWHEKTTQLDDAEIQMLNLYLQRAELQDGQDILELGCGWGSLTLWMAEQFPNSQITAVSNSHSQRKFIEHRAIELNLKNIRVTTCDVNQLTLEQQFDRIVSIEMFEHMRNYENLLQKTAQWLRQEGKLFIHIFCHRYLAYPFETDGDDNWMGQYFFTGGLMPARDTLLHFQKHFTLENRWDLSGTHYQKTAQAWLENLDVHQQEITQLFITTYGEEEASIWLQRWRIFFMSCAELFGYSNGNEWMVAHYLFHRR